MSLKSHDALANLAAHAKTLPEPYLVTGPQAAYLYHRWRLPIEKMVDLSIPQESVAIWQAILPEPWVVLTRPSTYTQLRQTTRMAILQPSLSESLWARRVIHQGLPFISPEDLSLHLLRTATTQIRLSELSALLIKQRDTLDWEYLINQIGSRRLLARLTNVIQTINREAGRTLLSPNLPESQVTSPAKKLLLKPASIIPILRPLRAQWRIANV